MSLSSYYGHFMVQPVRSKIQQQCVFFQQQPDLCVVLKLRVILLLFSTVNVFAHIFGSMQAVSKKETDSRSPDGH